MTAVAVQIPPLENSGPVWVASLAIREGQPVEQGQLLARLESRHERVELHAASSGYVVGLHARPGQTVLPGAVLCYLAEAPTVASGRPTGSLVPYAEQAPLEAAGILVYGGGGHGKAVIELLRAMRTFRVVGVIDDGMPPGSEVLGVPVLGGADQLKDWHDRGVRLAANGVGGIGDPQSRQRVFDVLLQAGFACPVLVHPSAVVEPSAVLEGGVQVLPKAYIGSAVRVGFGSVINVGAIVAHDCVLGRVTNLSPGAALAGGVHVEEFSQIGMNATVNLNVSVGAGCIIGNGADVKADVPAGTRVWAGSLWPPRPVQTSGVREEGDVP
jgi:acetyltransferase EpsM